MFSRSRNRIYLFSDDEQDGVDHEKRTQTESKSLSNHSQRLSFRSPSKQLHSVIHKQKNTHSNQHNSRFHQLYLDFGQSHFGPKQCPECKMIYTQSEPTDEKAHQLFHNSHSSFNNKLIPLSPHNAHPTSRILTVTHNSHTKTHALKHFGSKLTILIVNRELSQEMYWEKLKALNEVLKSSELSGIDVISKLNDTSGFEIFLAIINGNLIGCIGCESITNGYRIQQIKSDDSGVNYCFSCLDSDLVSVQCGFYCIWVHKSYRRQGIGMHLLHHAMNFRLNSNQSVKSSRELIDLCAFSAPTLSGMKLAHQFFDSNYIQVYKNQ